MRLFGWIVIVVAVAVSPAAAKEPRQVSPLVNAIDQCRKIADPMQRLACYDKTAGELVAATQKGDVNVVDRGQMRQARRSLFGFNMPKLPFFSGDESAKDAPDTLETTIKSVRELGYSGRYQIVLTEGNAIWETTEDAISLREPRIGQKIVIARGPMGSYFLRINGQRGIRGRRIG